MESKAIGLAGVPGSGKDEIAKCLGKFWGYHRYSFADEIRNDLYKLNPYVRMDCGSIEPLQGLVDTLGWEPVKRLSGDVRRLLQVYGTEVGRDGFSDNCWIDRVARKIDASGDRFLVFTDVRFENEVAYLQSFADWELWYVERPGCEVVNNHRSEQLYARLKEQAHCTIVNDMPLSEIVVKCAAAIHLGRIHAH